VKIFRTFGMMETPQITTSLKQLKFSGAKLNNLGSHPHSSPTPRASGSHIPGLKYHYEKSLLDFL